MFKKVVLILSVIILIAAIMNVVQPESKELSPAEMNKIKGGADKVGCTAMTLCGPASTPCTKYILPGGTGFGCNNGISQSSIIDCGEGEFTHCAHIGTPDVVCYNIITCEWIWTDPPSGYCRETDSSPNYVHSCRAWN